MQTFLTVALLVGAALLSGSYLWRDILPLLDRLVAVQERRYVPVQEKAAEPMPAHLEQAAMAWGTEQARDDTLTAMREAYAELGDWTLVASRFSGDLS
ncbi:hypothetical protein [Humibacter sp.]|uniref:hypothetical protein n=1 Tax=Humibacter sp. TaxID=1940291 RepID=UPI003F7FFE0E